MTTLWLCISRSHTEVILRLPKAITRKPGIVRKKAKTRILTDTSGKIELEKTHKEKEDKKENKKNEREKKISLKASNQTKNKKKIIIYSSSDESDIPTPLIDTTDYESSDVQSDDDDGDCPFSGSQSRLKCATLTNSLVFDRSVRD